MCLRISGRKVAGVHCFPQRNCGKPSQDPSFVNTNKPKASPETSCVHRGLKPFISKLGEKALPLYKLLRRTDNFKWTDVATAGLEEIKAFLASNPILAAPGVGEPMLLYISTTNQVVGVVLVIERGEEGHKFPTQKLVYYVSEVLTPCKSRYPHYQKIAYAVFMASQNRDTIFKSVRSQWHQKYHLTTL